MAEVRVGKIIQNYMDNGEVESEDPALVMLKQWPVSKQYKENSTKITPKNFQALKSWYVNYINLQNNPIHQHSLREKQKQL